MEMEINGATTMKNDRVITSYRPRVATSILGVAAAFAGLAGLFTGCLGDNASVNPSMSDPTAAIGALQLSPINTIMAVGDSIPLVVRGQTLSGAPITQLDSVQYILQNVADTLRVRIASTGVVTALTPSGTNNPVLIEVIGFKGGLARANQAIVQVTADKLVGATLSIHPVPPDSARMSWGSVKRIVPIVQSSLTGQRVASPTFRYEYGPGDSTTMQCGIQSLPPTATLTALQLQMSACGGSSVAINMIHANQKGTAWIIADATVYGVALRDSVQYTVTNPFAGTVNADPSFLLQPDHQSGSALLIAPGGRVTFLNSFSPALNAAVSWTFDNPSAATAYPPTRQYGGTTGNVTAVPSNQFAIRQFLTPGVYRWTATVSGGVPPYTGMTSSGFITVQ
jgi:hypothetical protein